MNPSLHLKSLGLHDIFVLGFEGTFSECLINQSSITQLFSIKEFENSFQVFQKLERILETNLPEDHLPKAIICEFASLQEENFLLLRNMLAHPELKFIPFIAMNRDGMNHKMEALKLGFDDYYDVPVRTEVLIERIKFLADFKRKINTCEFEAKEKYMVRYSPAKRIFDIFFALLAILILSPLLVLIALLIKFESPGPVIYRSKRVGTGYQVFDFFKFRSMYKNADQRLKDLHQLNQYKDNEGGLFLKFNNDPRVTTIGKFIRKTSIDELPQLFNILKGDMSIVGNRPLPLYEAELLTRDHWARRFLAPAGLTGLWQVTKRGKNDMSTEERIGLDITYADRHSFMFDMKIIMKTPFAIIQEENV